MNQSQTGRQAKVTDLLGFSCKEKIVPFDPVTFPHIQHLNFMCSMLQLAQIIFLIWSLCPISAGGVKYLQILSFFVVKYLQVMLNLANIILYCCQISARDVKYLQILSFLVVQYLQVMLNLILLSNMFKYYRILPSTICKCYLFLLSNICW